MMARDHLPFAGGCWVAAAALSGVSPLGAALGLPLALLGGLLPDIDHPSSTLGQRLPGLSHLTRWTLGHRGPTHSVLFLTLLILGGLAGQQWLTRHGASGLEAPLLAALVVGTLSHIAADLANPQGVPLWWPTRRRCHWPLLRWTSGSWIERVVAWGMVGVATVLALRTWISPALGLT